MAVILRDRVRPPVRVLFVGINPGVRSVDGTYDLYSLGADGVAGGEGFAAEIGNWGH